MLNHATTISESTQQHHGPDRPYIFYELTNSLCNTCQRKLEAKIIIQNEQVFLLKNCPEHGHQKVLISTDAEYYKKCRSFLKPGQMPLRFNTQTERGCPFDCGLCPDHEQHSCLTLIEVTDRCNLTCPICYAESSPSNGSHRSLGEIEFMLDSLVKNEGTPDIVQISGGDPTVHPQFFEILDLAKTKPIRHLMVNTNGVRLAQDKSFCERLATYIPGFELYLQFDSLKQNPLEILRGRDLREVRLKALDHLNEFNISTNLVVTLKKGLNDNEIGEIIEFALTQRCVRGVTFQPIQAAGRLEEFDPARDRLTLGEVRQQILKQHSLFTPDDLMPVPCHPDCIAMAYAVKTPVEKLTHDTSLPKAIPLSSLMDPELLLSGAGNTIVYEQHPEVKKKLFELFSLNHSPHTTSDAVHHLLCCLPGVSSVADLSYENVFRVTIMEFLDAYNFDVRSVKRSCVHIAHPDGRIIPFDTYNMFYRNNSFPKTL